ncbi:MAG: hypothetical protein B7Z31_04330 [Rhodobacterales bacterium 12-65-15]|nr:MAG: hypothetical protein B7Z31_04330 [Rhodobacterales bacterium 12-65-15]
MRLVALALAATALAHAPALWGGFLYDDLRDIVANPAAQATTFLERLPHTVRPLLKASYALQDAVHGVNAAAFHAVNIGLHLGAVVLVFLLVRRGVELAGLEDRANRIAILATLLWSLHPALTDTVSYVSGRSSGLSGLLVLAALVAATGRKARPWLAFLCAALAPLARETALVAPLLLLVFQATVGRGQPGSLRRAAPVWAGALVAAAVLAAMASHRDLVSFSLTTRGPLDALRANVFALPEALRLWLMPWEISILPRQPVIHGWDDPPTLIRSAALAFVTAAAIALRKRWPVVALAVLWTLMAMLPTNSVIWRVDPLALRPLYLAGIGLALLAALALARLPLVLGLAVAAALGTMSWDRATLYQDEVALFADATVKSPNEARTHLMYGLTLANTGQVAEARRVLEQALRLDPFLSEATNALRLLDAAAPVYSDPP